MNLTREDAELFLQMVNDVPKAMSLLTKIYEAYPDLVKASHIGKAVEAQVKKSAMQQISDYTIAARELIRKAEEIADRSDVGFTFTLTICETNFYEPNSGWTSESNN